MISPAVAPVPVRICIVNEYFYPDDAGGTGTVLSELAETLHRDYPDIQIDVVASNRLYRDGSQQLSTSEDWDGIHISRVNIPYSGGQPAPKRLAINLLFGIAALGKLLRRRRYDLLLIGTAPPTVAMAAALFRRLTRTPYLYIVYDLDPDRAVTLGLLSRQSPVAALLHRWQSGWLQSAGKVVVLGRCMQRYVSLTYKLPPDQITLIPIGSDAEGIRPLSKQTRFRAAHALNGFVVCYTGNFGRYHNFNTILDTARELQRRQAPITFVLVGGGAQKAHIARRIQDEGLTNVHLHHFVSKANYPDLLASADVSLVTLEPGMEGLCVPSKFYSILASGRPTIAMVSPESEISQVIQESACGVQIDHGDTKRLTEVLLQLSQAPEEVARMGHNARRTLEEHYSNRCVARQYYQAILEVLGRTEDRYAGIPSEAIPSLPTFSTLAAEGETPLQQMNLI